MRKVIFPLAVEDSLVVYPDDISLFGNTAIEGSSIVAEYHGTMELDDYTPVNIGPTKMSGLAFMDLVGDANMVALLTLAKTDPICELLVKKLDRADVIDFEDAERGPQVGMQYLLSIGSLTLSEYNRIVRREFL